MTYLSSSDRRVNALLTASGSNATASAGAAGPAVCAWRLAPQSSAMTAAIPITRIIIIVSLSADLVTFG